MENEVFMNIPEVRNIAQRFGTISEVLKGVSMALQGLIAVLRAAAFVGLVAAAVEAQFLEIAKRQIDQMASKCDELSQDVKASVDAYERGDAQGATRFY